MDSFLDLISKYIEIQTPTLGVCLAAVLAALLLLVSGFASGSEIAFFSLKPNDLDKMDTAKSKTDANIELLRNDSERTLATILILNNLVNVTIVMLSSHILSHIFIFKETWIEILFVTVLLTFLLLLFGEIMPKVYSRLDPLRFCRRAVRGIMFARKLFWMIENVLLRSSKIADKLVKKENRQLSIDELEQALELTNKNEIQEEKEMLKGIIRFVDKTAKEVMTSRQDIVDLDLRSNYAQVIRSIVENKFSRIPVYQDSSDNIRGILYIKDLLSHISKPSNFRWQSLIRPPYFVPETKKIDDLLREFQENKVHIAIVVDEYGGTSGLVTMEDILEEIVGEINDEFDDETAHFTQISPSVYLFEGKTPISEFTRVIGKEEDFFSAIEGDADSLAGLVLELKGDFPTLNECLTYEDIVFQIIGIDNRRITRIKITLKDAY